MIEQIHLENFKCFEKLDVELKSVNVLTGINGMGKSTIIQSLLLLKQSAAELMINGELRLNGELTQLGVGRDVLCESTENDREIVIAVRENSGEKAFHFPYEPFSDVLHLSGACPGLLECMGQGRCVYLSAYRIQPAKLYNITNENNMRARNFGVDGIFALQYLKEYGPRPILEELVSGEGEYENTLSDQVRKWMNEIAPGVTVDVSIDMEKQLAALGYSFVEGKNRTNTYNCVNVGFGITYVLPVVVALLSAQRGDLILLENPEAHIHPMGQRKLGELLCLAGNAGVQILIETHSDHILNGVRLSVKNQTIAKEDTNLFYFYKDAEDGFRHKYLSPRINDKGRLDHWPKGFFDEWDNAMMELL